MGSWCKRGWCDQAGSSVVALEDIPVAVDAHSRAPLQGCASTADWPSSRPVAARIPAPLRESTTAMYRMAPPLRRTRLPAGHNAHTRPAGAHSRAQR
jgi:hypothetical protein